MKDRLRLDHLVMFRDVIELGSFSAAAQRAGISQPAVSLQIRNLEMQLGTALVERIGRRATPTAAGVELLSYLGRIETSFADMTQAMARFTSGSAGRLRIGTGATACTYFLPQVLRRIRVQFPEVEIVVTTGNTSDVVAAIEENRIDVGFVTLPASRRVLEVTPLMRDEFVAIAPRDFPLPKRLTPSALTELPVLLFEPGGNTRRIADEWLARAGSSLKPIMSLGSVEAIKALVGAGLGCAIVPQMAVQSASSALVTRPLSPRLYRKLAIVIRRDRPQQRVLKMLIASLRQLAGGASGA